MNQHQFNQLINAIKILERTTCALGIDFTNVIGGEPNAYKAAIKAACAISGCKPPVLTLVVFGRTFKGDTRVNLRSCSNLRAMDKPSRLAALNSGDGIRSLAVLTVGEPVSNAANACRDVTTAFFGL